MRSSLRSSARRGVTVLVGTALFALAASGAAEATTVVDAAVTIVSEPAAQSAEPPAPADWCDITPAC